ncbi:DUF1249 domain-containing protein [Solimonas sp. K1W22B-7]|uniref:DUF1249 domain-containing protein n=1 Tax=Solimonas sp. K1W22B-7 TaxID=2303331 RepID=UPI000E32E66B|nr:DUF1249 domain-containing protein [Solimonas sp. K1W22B-7]AXQ29178.1 DUF1249 domain-containing protein [Solimonas sp. K1W22B-7]
MQASTGNGYICPCCGKPRRLAHLLDLYDRNYHLLERLIPELELPFDEAVSRSQSDLPLHLKVTDRDRYTVSFRLSYEFVDEQGVRRQPDLWVRVYRDAAVAEALACSQRPPWDAREEGDPKAGQFLSAQWQRNLMLGKWLEYLLEHGHGFSLAARPRLHPTAAL